MLDKSKVATLVKMKAPMPAMPRKAPAAPAAGNPNDGHLKPGAAAKPAPDKVSLDEMTPQELAAMVEEAAQEAEAGQDTELEDALVDFLNGDTSQPPQWAGDAELWQKAIEAVGVGTPDEAKYDEPLVVAAYLYKKLGGAVGGEPAAHEAGEAPHEEAAEHAAKPKPGAAKPAMGAKPPAPGAKPGAKPAAAPAKGGVGNPALKQPPVHGEAGEGQEPGGQLKQVLDQAAEQAKTNPDPQLKEKLAGYDPARDGNPPSWATDPDKWAEAEKAVKPHWDEYDEPYAVVAHVYKNMGGGVQ